MNQTELYCEPESVPRFNYAPFANKEAYSLFLERWSRVELYMFCQSTTCVPESCKSSGIVYFNTEIDTLYVGSTFRFSEEFEPTAFKTLREMPISRTLRFVAFEMHEWSLEMSTTAKWEQNNIELEFLSCFPKLELIILVDYDVDSDWLDTNRMPLGEIEFVNPTQIDRKDRRDQAPGLLSRLADLLERHPKANVPLLAIKEVLRGGVRIERRKSWMW